MLTGSSDCHRLRHSGRIHNSSGIENPCAAVGTRSLQKDFCQCFLLTPARNKAAMQQKEPMFIQNWFHFTGCSFHAISRSIGLSALHCIFFGFGAKFCRESAGGEKFCPIEDQFATFDGECPEFCIKVLGIVSGSI